MDWQGLIFMERDSMKEYRIGFIGGGKMAEALIKGIIEAKLFEAVEILVSEPVADRGRYLADQYGVAVSTDNRKLVASCRNVLLAVKPQSMAEVLEDIAPAIEREILLISIAAGVPLAFFQQRLPQQYCRLVRVMPNTPALVLAAASAISPAAGVGQQDVAFVVELFNAVGRSVVVEEKYLDAVTGLSGSGPAYVFSFIEALVDAGLKVGLDRRVAEELVLQTVYGSVLLAMKEKAHPAVLRSMVTSPGGTTIAGLHQFAKGGFSGLVMDAVEAATARSRELGSS